VTKTADFRPVMHIHFIGIGGAGMGGIAEVLHNLGYQVSGSDQGQNAITSRLQSLGVKITIGHHVDNIAGAQVIVLSSAIHEDNLELIAAKNARIPLIPRARMLADLMRFKKGIAIAGTHGKTTTTSLVASALAEGGLDPTFVIGGLLKSTGTHAYLGASEYFVAEADESDASFLYLHPQVAIVTNIDIDHLTTYHNDFSNLRRTFLEFLDRLPFDGLAVVCIDDPIIHEIISDISRPTLTYGFHESADIQLFDFTQVGTQSYFKIRRKDNSTEVSITLNLPGRHNALNAAAAFAVASKMGVPDAAIQAAFAKFAGVGRRFQIYGEFNTGVGSVLLIDDYGHHPREITATVSAIRGAWPERRLVMAYQPHRYTRTKELFQDFVKVLSEQIDQLLLLDIYSAGESPIPEADGESLYAAIRKQSKSAPIFVKLIDELPSALRGVLEDGDVLLLQGAGSIGLMAAKLAAMQLKL
jgi:UDP-N-acetylmuramate--alanine ligase